MQLDLESADGPQTAGLVIQPFQTVAEDILFGLWDPNARDAMIHASITQSLSWPLPCCLLYAIAAASTGALARVGIVVAVFLRFP